MKCSEDISSIAKALVKAQKEIGTAHKDSKNPFFKSNYADLNSVMDACKEPLNKQGISIVQSVGADDIGKYVETMFIHESGQYMASKMHLILSKNDMQGFGSAISYARRYTLQAMAFVGADDDDGNATIQQKKAAPKKKQPAKNVPKAKANYDAVVKLVNEKINNGCTPAALLKHLGVKTRDDLLSWDESSLLDAYNSIKEVFGGDS